MEFPQSVHAQSIVQEYKKNMNLSIKIQGSQEKIPYTSCFSTKRYLSSTIVLANTEAEQLATSQ